MPINEAYQNNFEVLNRAARNGDLCLMETKGALTGKTVMPTLIDTHAAYADSRLVGSVDGNTSSDSRISTCASSPQAIS